MYKYKIKREQPVTFSAFGYSYIKILQQNVLKSKRKPTIELERGKRDCTATGTITGKKISVGKCIAQFLWKKYSQLSWLFINSQSIP